uniref:E3 ubiquitin-protein ligase n=1 Tax=Oryzias latipes TaxID=8090 RepID=A0A3P9IYB2_ORYLA
MRNRRLVKVKATADLRQFLEERCSMAYKTRTTEPEPHEPSGVEITDIHLTVPQTLLKDPKPPRIRILKKRDAFCVVTGTFKDLEKLVEKHYLPKSPQKPVEKHYLPKSPQKLEKNDLPESPQKLVEKNDLPESPPVVVRLIVLEYMESKCKEKLERILGENFDLKTGPEHNGTAQVMFKRLQGSAGSSWEQNFVRQRFITFYQRTASDLKLMNLDLCSRDLSELKQRFPLLLFKKTKPVTVIGPYSHVAKLDKFLHPSPRSRRGSAGPASGRLSNSSPRQRSEEMCPICMEPMAAKDTEQLRCKHSFCKDCLKQAFSYKKVCPVCGELYGVLKGTQPDVGYMDISKDPIPLQGYEKYGTIVIKYYVPDGIQKEEHPNPGQPYQGVSRTAYLPDSPEGRAILKLLQRAFEQRLIFTIGRSTTSGRSNVVTWNDIHHKTSKHGGPSHYGYPDPAYLSRVREELKVKGIK